MNDDTQSTTDTKSDAEPIVSETSTASPETPMQRPAKKKAGRGANSAKGAKAPNPAKSARTLKEGNSEEIAASDGEEVVETGPKPATNVKLASRAKTAKPVKPTKSAQVAKGAKRAKPGKATEAAKTAKPTKIAKLPTKAVKAAPAIASKYPATVAVGGRETGARYTTNQLSSEAKKAGLTVQFTPVVMGPVNIGRGPAKEFKIDTIIACLRGSNGDIINERGPGTPFFADEESLAAVKIFQKFRGRTFHNKLKVQIL